MNKRILLLTILLMSAIILSGCANCGNRGGEICAEGYMRDYEIVYVEGMPCLWVDYGNEAGFTCDWSQWDGNE